MGPRSAVSRLIVGEFNKKHKSIASMTMTTLHQIVSRMIKYASETPGDTLVRSVVMAQVTIKTPSVTIAHKNPVLFSVEVSAAPRRPGTTKIKNINL